MLYLWLSLKWNIFLTAENSAPGTTLINIRLCEVVQIWTRVQKYIGEFLISNIAPVGIDPDVKSVSIVEQRIE